MSWVEDMAVVPARFSVVNLATNEEVVAQFNPPDFDEEVSSEWNRLSTPGSSRERMHFANTKNYAPSLDLYFTALTVEDYDNMNRAKHQLMSWVYPRAGSGNAPGQGPPRLLATWPLVFSIECYLISCRFRNSRFAPDGRVTRYTASVKFEDCDDSPLTSEQVALAAVVRGEL